MKRHYVKDFTPYLDKELQYTTYYYAIRMKQSKKIRGRYKLDSEAIEAAQALYTTVKRNLVVTFVTLSFWHNGTEWEAQTDSEQEVAQVVKGSIICRD